MVKKSQVKATSTMLKDPQYREAMSAALGDMTAYSKMLTDVDKDMSAEDAQKEIAQMMFSNMRWMEEPVAAAKYLLAKQMTFQQVIERVDPEQALLDIDNQIKLQDTMRKTINLVHNMEKKGVTAHVNFKDDKEIVIMNPDFVEAGK